MGLLAHVGGSPRRRRVPAVWPGAEPAREHKRVRVRGHVLLVALVGCVLVSMVTVHRSSGDKRAGRGLKQTAQNTAEVPFMGTQPGAVPGALIAGKRHRKLEHGHVQVEDGQVALAVAATIAAEAGGGDGGGGTSGGGGLAAADASAVGEAGGAATGAAAAATFSAEGNSSGEDDDSEEGKEEEEGSSGQGERDYSSADGGVLDEEDADDVAEMQLEDELARQEAAEKVADAVWEAEGGGDEDGEDEDSELESEGIGGEDGGDGEEGEAAARGAAAAAAQAGQQQGEAQPTQAAEQADQAQQAQQAAAAVAAAQMQAVQPGLAVQGEAAEAGDERLAGDEAAAAAAAAAAANTAAEAAAVAAASGAAAEAGAAAAAAAANAVSEAASAAAAAAADANAGVQGDIETVESSLPAAAGGSGIRPRRRKSAYHKAVQKCDTLACLREAGLTKQRHKGQFRFPHFLIIGWQKCATTSLFHHLVLHPNVQCPSEKEPEFFTYDCAYDPLNCPLDKQRDYIQETMHINRVLRHNLYRAMFEGSTHYARQGPRIAPGLAELFPWVKLVASMREPISRGISMLAHNLDKNSIGCLTRRDVFACLERDLPGLNYTTPFSAWTAAFPKEQIMLLQYESLTHPDHTARHLAEVKSFLELDPAFPASELEKSNSRESRLGKEPEGWPMKRRQYQRLVELVRPDAEGIAALVTEHGLGDGKRWMANWEKAWQANFNSCNLQDECVIQLS